MMLGSWGPGARGVGAAHGRGVGSPCLQTDSSMRGVASFDPELLTPCAEGGVCSLRKAIRTAMLSASNPLVFHLLSASFIRARTTSLDSW